MSELLEFTLAHKRILCENFTDHLSCEEPEGDELDK